MSVVDLELFKRHARIDFDDDDSYVTELLESAEESVVKATNRTAEELCELNGGIFPASLRQAIRMLAAHWYNVREAAGGANLSEVPYSLQALVKPWRKLADDESGTDEKPAEDPEAGDEEEQLGE